MSAPAHPALASLGMKALVQDVYGSPDVLRLEDVDPPQPAAGEVLVRVAAASVNAADWHTMRGEPRIARLMNPGAFGRTGPRERIRGRDFAGTIEALGSGSRHRVAAQPCIRGSWLGSGYMSGQPCRIASVRSS